MAYVTIKGLNINYEDSNLYQSIRASIQWLQVKASVCLQCDSIEVDISHILSRIDRQSVLRFGLSDSVFPYYVAQGEHRAAESSHAAPCPR